jgi:uncharacterized protein
MAGLNLTHLRQYKAEILASCQKYHASNIRVFGSVARNEATETSDVDFLVDMPKSQSILQRIHLKQDLEEILACHVDVVRADSLPDLIVEQVLQEACPL